VELPGLTTGTNYAMTIAGASARFAPPGSPSPACSATPLHHGAEPANRLRVLPGCLLPIKDTLHATVRGLPGSPFAETFTYNGACGFWEASFFDGSGRLWSA
jgi:hypothetical protein